MPVLTLHNFGSSRGRTSRAIAIPSNSTDDSHRHHRAILARRARSGKYPKLPIRRVIRTPGRRSLRPRHAGFDRPSNRVVPFDPVRAAIANDAARALQQRAAEDYHGHGEINYQSRDVDESRDERCG